MAKNQPEFRPVAFSLRAEDVAALKHVAQSKGLNGSAVLRLAIHDYAQRERRRERAEAAGA